MRVTMLATYLQARTFKDKDTNKEKSIGTFVVDGDVFEVQVEPEDFERFDVCVLSGDLGVFDRRKYLKEPYVRNATAEEIQFLSGNSRPAEGVSKSRK